MVSDRPCNIAQIAFAISWKSAAVFWRRMLHFNYWVQTNGASVAIAGILRMVELYWIGRAFVTTKA